MQQEPPAPRTRIGLLVCLLRLNLHLRRHQHLRDIHAGQDGLDGDIARPDRRVEGRLDGPVALDGHEVLGAVAVGRTVGGGDGLLGRAEGGEDAVEDDGVVVAGALDDVGDGRVGYVLALYAVVLGGEAALGERGEEAFAGRAGGEGDGGGLGVTFLGGGGVEGVVDGEGGWVGRGAVGVGDFEVEG